MPIAAKLMPVTMVSRKKPPASASESRFEMVMVRRSLDAANAIRAGNSKSLITSVSMIVVLARESLVFASNYAVQACGSVSARNI